MSTFELVVCNAPFWFLLQNVPLHYYFNRLNIDFFFKLIILICCIFLKKSFNKFFRNNSTIIEPTNLRLDSNYQYYYISWFRSITLAFVPFVLLLVLNGKIISTLHGSETGNVMVITSTRVSAIFLLHLIYNYFTQHWTLISQFISKFNWFSKFVHCWSLALNTLVQVLAIFFPLFILMLRSSQYTQAEKWHVYQIWEDLNMKNRNPSMVTSKLQLAQKHTIRNHP